MSFASEIKKELTAIDSEKAEQIAELSALIRMNGVVSFSRHHYTLDVQTENAAIARRIYTLIKENFTQVEQHRITYTKPLAQELVPKLLQMTPMGWHVEQKEQVQLPQITIDVSILVGRV